MNLFKKVYEKLYLIIKKCYNDIHKIKKTTGSLRIKQAESRMNLLNPLT